MNYDLTVKICQADTPNKNNRLYSSEVLQSAIEKVATKEMLGTIGMPEGPSVDLADVSHTITDLRLEGGFLVGKVKVLKTPKGKLLEELLSQPPSLDFRLAGVGQVDSNGVVSNFTITSVNAVYDGA
jgi:hypothetical protein